MGDYRSLHVWKRAHGLALTTYSTTRAFPRDELFGLTSQMRRAAVSVAANLAEGCGRDSDAEIARFARISLGSASELEYFLLLSGDLGYIDPTEQKELLDEVAQIKPMLAKLAHKLSRSH
jgi:four helix bundle protein